MKSPIDTPTGLDSPKRSLFEAYKTIITNAPTYYPFTSAPKTALFHHHPMSLAGLFRNLAIGSGALLYSNHQTYLPNDSISDLLLPYHSSRLTMVSITGALCGHLGLPLDIVKGAASYCLLLSDHLNLMKILMIIATDEEEVRGSVSTVIETELYGFMGSADTTRLIYTTEGYSDIVAVPIRYERLFALPDSLLMNIPTIHNSIHNS
eukprot:Tbor_TRINITY_DN5737_c3_g1::TRINITY_DN5737_c3_g1_i1::g.19676::m.19676